MLKNSTTDEKIVNVDTNKTKKLNKPNENEKLQANIGQNNVSHIVTKEVSMFRADRHNSGYRKLMRNCMIGNPKWRQNAHVEFIDVSNMI